MAKRNGWEGWQDIPPTYARQVLLDLEEIAVVWDGVAGASEPPQPDDIAAMDQAAAFRVLADELRRTYLDEQ